MCGSEDLCYLSRSSLSLPCNKLHIVLQPFIFFMDYIGQCFNEMDFNKVSIERYALKDIVHAFNSAAEML